MNASEYQRLAYQLRKNILTSAYKGGGGHIGGCFSIIDALVVLYGQILSHSPEDPIHPDRDRLLFSKGHACLALYHTLAHHGYFDPALLDTYGQDGAAVGGHPERNRLPGIEMTAGSLGHGPSIGVGVALAGKIQKKDYWTFVVVGDGECNEGSVYEACGSAYELGLERFVLIVDYNGMMTLKDTGGMIGAKRFRAHGFRVLECQGNSVEGLVSDLSEIKELPSPVPTVVLLDTTKGMGVSFMENEPKWHYRQPSDEEYDAAMAELDEAISHA